MAEAVMTAGEIVAAVRTRAANSGTSLFDAWEFYAGLAQGYGSQAVQNVQQAFVMLFPDTKTPGMESVQSPVITQTAAPVVVTPGAMPVGKVLMIAAVAAVGVYFLTRG